MQPGVGISNGSPNGDLSTFRFPCDDESTLSLSALDDVEGLETALPLSTDDFPFVASTTNAAALEITCLQGAWAAALGTISAEWRTKSTIRSRTCCSTSNTCCFD